MFANNASLGVAQGSPYWGRINISWNIIRSGIEIVGGENIAIRMNVVKLRMISHTNGLNRITERSEMKTYPGFQNSSTKFGVDWIPMKSIFSSVEG